MTDESEEREMTALVIDCTECESGSTEHCEDCLVAFIIDRPAGAVVFDAAEERALRSLRDGGLLPNVRLDRKTG